jgi:competence ComEA-like helix-hairpin-helix protein
MIDRIKDYFAFNKKEQRGLIVLLGLMLLSAAVNIFLPYLVPEKHFDITPFQKEVEQFLASAEKQDSAGFSKSQNNFNDFKEDNAPVLSAFMASPYYFDPNELYADDWKAMGMDDRIAGNIIRYREKGGKFRDKEGFRKIYGLNDEIYDILEPYIRIAEEAKKSKFSDHDTVAPIDQHGQSKFKKYQRDTILIELNSSDSSLLLDLNGIGPTYAGRIIKYREKLGGFYKKEQLLEIKGMDSIRFGQFRDQVTIDPLLIRKIDLNNVTFKDLLKHPYFEYYLVKAIFQKKDEIKRFDSVEQIRGIPVMYEELYEKIAPYLVAN